MADSSVTLEADSASGIFHKPCAFVPHGVSRSTCEKTSGIIRMNARCCETNCASKARACRVCIRQAMPKHGFVVNPVTGLCAFHEEHGEEARVASGDVLKDIERARVAKLGTMHREARLEETRAATMGTLPEPVGGSRGEEILDRIRLAISKATLIDLDPHVIRPMPNQPRKYFNQERLRSLCVSMKRHGQLSPGMVRAVQNDPQGRTHELLDGERRLRAALMGDLPYRALLIEIDDEAAPYVISIIANFNREGHTAMEMSDGIVVMMGLGLTVEQIAKAISLSTNYISRLHGLQRLVPEVRALLDPEAKRVLPTTAAMEISALNPENQLEHAQAFLDKNLTMVDLKMAARNPKTRSGHVRNWTESNHDKWRRISNRAKKIEQDLKVLAQLVDNAPVPEGNVQRQYRVSAMNVLEETKAQTDNVVACLKAKL